MTPRTFPDAFVEPERYELFERGHASFDLNRREFLKILGPGLLILSYGSAAVAQRFGRGEGDSQPVAARLHIGQDGMITVMTGKVEVGQGSRAQLTQAAAEELRVDPSQIQLIMADTDLVPDDGGTYGSQTTPRTVPAVRRGAAAARELLIHAASQRFQVDRNELVVEKGTIKSRSGSDSITYAELAQSAEVAEEFKESVPSDIELRQVAEWEVLGTSVPRPNRRDIVTGAHRYPSDIVRSNMVYGKILRPGGFGATLVSIDLSVAENMEGVQAIRDGDFVGCVAPNSFLAGKAVEALAKTAVWEVPEQSSSKELFAHLKDHAEEGEEGGGRRRRGGSTGSIEEGFSQAAETLQAEFEIAYIQHAPLEPRAAVAEWENDKVTVWTGSQVPTRVHRELCEAFDLQPEQARVIIPDTGGGFGGKHTGEAAVEAARLARAAGRPVSLRWSREEEFTWAYFRPAGVIQTRGGVNKSGRIVAWDFTNINSGGSSIDTPYNIPNTRIRSLDSDSPLRQGSYRALAATANNFAREVFMDELASKAGADPFEFRISHLEEDRMKDVLEAAYQRFDWAGRKERKEVGTGIGLACGTEKNSYVAACVEVAVDRSRGEIRIRHICQSFECGAIQNPDNLKSQVQGCVIMGLGGALTEAIEFENGKILNDRFSKYRVPRFKDVPAIDIHLLDRPEIPSVGAGETPIIAIAPALSNAVFDATGIRLRTMPLQAELLKET